MSANPWHLDWEEFEEQNAGGSLSGLSVARWSAKTEGSSPSYPPNKKREKLKKKIAELSRKISKSNDILRNRNKPDIQKLDEQRKALVIELKAMWQEKYANPWVDRKL